MNKQLRKFILIVSLTPVMFCYTNCSGGFNAESGGSSKQESASSTPPTSGGDTTTPTDPSDPGSTTPPTTTPPTTTPPTTTPPTTTPPVVVTPPPPPSNPANPYGTWVLTGYGGRHITSADGGKTWTNDFSDVANGSDDKWLQRAAIFFKGAFITLGWRIQRSTDGIQFQSSNFLPQWYGGVAEGNGRIVAVGGCGGRAYSNDGLNWTDVPDNTCSDHLRDVVYGNGIFFAYGTNGARMTSVDGITWKKLSAYDVTGVAFGFGYFWGVGTNKLVRSTDGVTWTDVTVAGATGVSGFNFVNNFLLLTTNSKNYRSLDGTTWSAFGSGMSGKVSYGGGVYIGLTWQTVSRSTDGMNWTTTKSGGNSFDATAWAP